MPSAWFDTGPARWQCLPNSSFPVTHLVHSSDLFLRPDTLDEALAFRAETGARVLAGGTDLFPSTDCQTLAGPLLDIGGIASLRGVSKTADGLCIGSATTWTDIVHADLPPAFDALKQAGRLVGSAQIQNSATLGGNLCNASPAADGVPPLLVLDASVDLQGPPGTRRIALADFLEGNRKTVLKPDEILVAVHVPDHAMRGVARFEKLGARAHLVISIAMVAVRLEWDNADRLSAIAVSVGACSAVARRLPELEAALQGQHRDDICGVIQDQMISDQLAPIDDVRADADYRLHAAVTLVRRVLQHRQVLP